ncbi:MAG TPA: hypothetical protein DGK91_14690 [Clostridium sp.]|jgi:hypothetical protein|nr:hypothetical protein [Clostridia bacterium]HCW05646.1 hypothetical protein [Clostridium sp.]
MTCAYIRKNTITEDNNQDKVHKDSLQVNNNFQRKLAKDTMKESDFTNGRRGEKYIAKIFKRFITDGHEDRLDNQ